MHQIAMQRRQNSGRERKGRIREGSRAECNNSEVEEDKKGKEVDAGQKEGSKYVNRNNASKYRQLTACEQ